MSNFSLNTEPNIIATVKFIHKGTDTPIKGPEYRVRLYDKDLIEDDFLGESNIDENGVDQFTFDNQSFSDFANADQYPDFYFILFKNDEALFKSKVMDNVNLSVLEEFKSSKGEVINLGTFLVEG